MSEHGLKLQILVGLKGKEEETKVGGRETKLTFIDFSMLQSLC